VVEALGRHEDSRFIKDMFLFLTRFADRYLHLGTQLIQVVGVGADEIYGFIVVVDMRPGGNPRDAGLIGAGINVVKT
jgi:hypothetical protein